MGNLPGTTSVGQRGAAQPLFAHLAGRSISSGRTECGNGAGSGPLDTPINILIVDDEPKNLTVLETILDHPAYRLVRAETGEQALLALLENDFALLILDIRMPSMTGFELAKVIRERRKNASVPIIFLTAYYNEDQHIIEGYDAGAVDYLHKPVNAAILRSKVTIFVDMYRKRLDLEDLNRALVTEIESRRRAEDQLREFNSTLEQRVLERTEHISLLMREVDHRSKNILAIVQSIARQTVTTQPDNFMERFSQRLGALAASHDLLVKTQWQGTDMKDVMLAQLAHLGELVGERMSLTGVPIRLSSAAAQILGMAVHELSTNACKYGSLSSTEGRVDVGWAVVGERLSIDWVETGGPPVVRPERRGMGSKVLETITAMSLAGNAKLAFEHGGLSWHLDCPLDKVCEGARKGETPMDGT